MSSQHATRGELHTIFGRSLREQRRALIGWISGIAGFCLIMLSMYPTIRGNTAFSKLLDAYPEPLRKLFNLSDYTSGVGYLSTEVFSFMAPLLISIFAILLGSDLLAGEEERRTIDILMANPVSRRRVVFEKWLALATGTLLLSLVLELVIGLIGPLFRLHVGWRPLSAEILGVTLFALFSGTLALAIGAATGSRGLARGVSTALTVAMYLVSTLAQIVSWLKSVEWTSLWYHSLGTDPIRSGFLFWHIVVVVVVTGALLLAAVLMFDRRDLAT